MGRWKYSKRRTVDETVSISVQFLNVHRYFKSGIRPGGCIWWRNGEPIGRIGFMVSTLDGDEYIRFQYTYTNRNTDENRDFDYKVYLTSTPCYFGGRRWWFICPLVNTEHACNRRVGILYLADGIYFGCRHCHNLTYKSCKESHKSDIFLRCLRLKTKLAK